MKGWRTLLANAAVIVAGILAYLDTAGLRDVLPPRGFAAELPVSRSRCSHLTAVLIATSKSSAASRRDAPDATDAINRSRKSLEKT